MQKQSGPGNGVKSALNQRSRAQAGFMAALVTAITLAACATTWHHPHKTGAEVDADKKACAQKAEDTVLLRSGTPRTEYSTRTTQPAGGLDRGESPMELHERSRTTNAYNTEFEDCMEAKGYTKE